MTEETDHILYMLPVSPFSMRIIMQIRLKDLQIEMLEPPGGIHSKAYSALAPIAKVPALKLPGGTVVGESSVIANYLEDRFPHCPLLPLDPEERIQARLGAHIAELYIMNRMLPIFAQLDPATRVQATVENIITDIFQGLGWLEDHCKMASAGYDAPYVTCTLVPILYYVERILPLFGKDVPLNNFPHVAALYERMCDSTISRESIGKLDTALTAYGL